MTQFDNWLARVTLWVSTLLSMWVNVVILIFCLLLLACVIFGCILPSLRSLLGLS